MARTHVLLLACVVLLGACEMWEGVEDEAPAADETTELSADEAADAGEEVALTIYLRTGSSPEAMLKPVTRDVPIEGNLPRRAVELLLEGPEADEELERPWPAGTEILGIDIDGGVATVDLSAHALEEAPDREHVPHLEALALGSLANTLTEFPAIESVHLTVDGESQELSEAVNDFWGGWGLPASLTRDESLVGQEGSRTIPDFAGFHTDTQSIGEREAAPVHIRSIRMRDRITYFRLVVEVADAQDREASAADFPRAHARTRPDELVLEVTGVDSVDEERVISEVRDQLEPYVSEVQVAEGRRPQSVRVTLTPATDARRPIQLHTIGSPSRIVLDVMKQPAHPSHDG